MIHGHGDDLYKYKNVEMNFSTNIFNHFDHSRLFAYLSEKLPLITSYPEPAPASLERTIARQTGVEADCIMVTNGATEAIYLIAQCFSGKTQHILQPTFAEYGDACSMYGSRIHTLSKITPSDRFGNDDTVWFCNPNNPTGTVTDHDVVSAVISNNPDTLFIIDQSYSHYTLKRTLQPRERACQGNVLLLNSMTKDFGIPGLRLGFVTASRRLISLLRSHRMPWSVNSLCSERERVGKLIEELGIMTYPSDSNMLLCRLPESDAATLKEFLVASHSILIRDASNFETLTPQHFRIAVQTREENDKLIKSLEEWMKQ